MIVCLRVSISRATPVVALVFWRISEQSWNTAREVETGARQAETAARRSAEARVAELEQELAARGAKPD